MKTLKEILVEGEVIRGPWKGKPADNDAGPTGAKSGASHFKKFYKDNVEHHEGHSSTLTNAYDSYHEHAEKHNLHPMKPDEFHQHMKNHGIIVQKTAGRVRYIGIKVKDHD